MRGRGLRERVLLSAIHSFISLIILPSVQGASPPSLTNQPNKSEIIFRDSGISTEEQGDSVLLECEATGEPKPSYQWYKDGSVLDLEKRLRHSWTQPGTGSVKLSDLSAQDEGVYQCHATNSFGTALSTRVHLRQAVLKPFRTRRPTVHNPVIGTPLTLTCEPPYSYPPPLISWGITSRDQLIIDKLIQETERVALDYLGNVHITNVLYEDDQTDKFSYTCSVLNGLLKKAVHGPDHLIRSRSSSGRLHFSNVELEDGSSSGEGEKIKKYVCSSYNKHLRTSVEGDDQIIYPTPNPNGPASHSPPSLMWSSPSSDVAVAGSAEKKIKCIFGGYPTPRVSWKKLGEDELPEDVSVSAHGLELTLYNVTVSHAGIYMCSASNSAGTSAPVYINVAVEYAPEWMKKVENSVVVEEGMAVFECVAVGHPEPLIQWLINGVPVEHLTPSDRRFVTKNSLTFDRVTKLDSQVIQCLASNTHGSIMSNAFLYVLAEPPTFAQMPDLERKVAEGETVLLDCRGAGVPQPRILWTRGEASNPLNGRRFVQHSNGTLEIRNVMVKDGDLFKCVAANKFGNNTASSHLRVRKRTTLGGMPAELLKKVSDVVELNCEVRSDEREMSSLKVEWTVNDKPLTSILSRRVTHDPLNHRITIHSAMLNDTGNYTCSASSDIDSASITTELIVRDRPSPPTEVLLDSCTSSSAELFWNAGADNNAEIIDYTVYFNTSHDTMVHQANTTTFCCYSRVVVYPWTNYTFHVRARNAVGVSDPSDGTPGLCTTPQMKPFRNPKGVCVKGGETSMGEIIVQWQRNGEGFHYEINYKREGSKDKGETISVTDWKQSQVTIYNLEIYKKYEVVVNAVNDLGRGRRSKMVRNRHTGYSSEGVPIVRPEGFEVDDSSVTSKEAEFSWDPVVTDEDNMKGYFVGYQIQYWRTDNPSEVRKQNVIKRERPAECLPEELSKDEVIRRRRQSSRETGALETGAVRDLWPGSDITAGVAAMNSARVGPLSETIQFKTLDGLPEEVDSFWVEERGSNHFIVAWLPPKVTNGKLTHYAVTYKPAKGRGSRREVLVPDVKDTRKKLIDLEPLTEYELSVEPHTSAGPGPSARRNDVTLALAAPDKPVIEHLVTGDDYVVVMWKPSEHEPPNNPALYYHVDYKPEGEGNVTRMTVRDTENKANVSGLDWGVNYEFVVTGVNSKGKETHSDMKSATVGIIPGETRTGTASLNWFIILMTIIGALLLILLILCALKCGRQGKYPVLGCKRQKRKPEDKDDICQNSDEEIPLAAAGSKPKRTRGKHKPDEKTDTYDNINEENPQEESTPQNSSGKQNPDDNIDKDEIYRPNNSDEQIPLAGSMLKSSPEKQNPEDKDDIYKNSDEELFIPLAGSTPLSSCGQENPDDKDDIYKNSDEEIPEEVQEKERLHGYNSESEQPFDEYGKGVASGLAHSGSLDSDVKPLGSESDSLDEYDDTDPNKFNEDGSFIGIYGSGRRAAPDYDPLTAYKFNEDGSLVDISAPGTDASRKFHDDGTFVYTTLSGRNTTSQNDTGPLIGDYGCGRRTGQGDPNSTYTTFI